MDDWKAGDLALCIANRHPKLGSTNRVKPGRIYTVVNLYVSSVCGTLALVLAEARPKKNPGFHHFLFRKIAPHAPDDQDAETIRLLNGASTERELA